MGPLEISSWIVWIRKRGLEGAARAEAEEKDEEEEDFFTETTMETVVRIRKIEKILIFTFNENMYTTSFR